MHYIYIFCSIRSPRRLYKMLNSTKLYIERRPPSRAIIMMVQASRMPLLGFGQRRLWGFADWS
jgi:hypothetical protein